MQILAVDGGDRVLASQFARLRWAGYEMSPVGDFETARKMLLSGENHVDLLITNLRLHDYNGLHLVILAHLLGASTAAIVVDDAADLSQVEAHQLGAEYLGSRGDWEQLEALVKDAITAGPLHPSAPVMDVIQKPFTPDQPFA